MLSSVIVVVVIFRLGPLLRHSCLSAMCFLALVRWSLCRLDAGFVSGMYPLSAGFVVNRCQVGVLTGRVKLCTCIEIRDPCGCLTTLFPVLPRDLVHLCTT